MEDDVAAALRSMADSIEASDSFEGSLQYTATDRDTFEVDAFWRVGNSEGQGGAVVI